MGVGVTDVFLDTNGVLTTFDAPFPGGTHPSGINNQRQIVGFSNGACWVYANGSFNVLFIADGTCQQANGINDSGQIIGTFQNKGVEHGFVYANNVFTTFDAPGANVDTDPLGINDLGQIVGTYCGNGPGGLFCSDFLATPISPFPEPPSTLLLGSGLAVLGILRLRTRMR